MKKVAFLFIAISVIAVSGCRKVTNQITTVVKDCTGTYIRYEGMDYKVCNTDKTDLFASGETVKTSFKKLKECNGPGNTAVTCAMLHENNGWIEVQKISKQ